MCFLRDALKSSYIILCMHTYLPNCNPWPLRFTNHAKYQIHKIDTCKHFHSHNKVHLSSFFQSFLHLTRTSSSSFFIETLMVDTSGFQAWHNKTQEMEKPNGKTNPNILQTFFSKLSDNKIHFGFSFTSSACRISRTYKRTYWDSTSV